MTSKQPTCPSCQSPDLRIEDVTTGRAQCGRCRHRCVIAPDGSTRDWLRSAGQHVAGTPDTTPRRRKHPARLT